jgi:hypothetical protein
MIVNNERTQAISNLGWADGSALWLYSSKTAVIRKVSRSDAQYLTILPGTEDFFAVVHHWKGERLEITAHHHSDPQQVISRVSVQRRMPIEHAELKLIFEGDRSAWSQLPRAYVGFVGDNYRLIQPGALEFEDVQELSWYDDTYDKGYQGIVGVFAIPNSRNLVVSVQRDSNPVVYDPATKQVVRKLSLVNGYGNPEFVFRKSANELWASDYDSLVKLDVGTLDVKQSLLVQGGVSGSRAFMGNFCFNGDENICLVARPFSGDALLIDANSMRQIRTIKLNGQPLEIVLFADTTVVARDWKSGNLLLGRL